MLLPRSLFVPFSQRPLGVVLWPVALLLAHCAPKLPLPYTQGQLRADMREHPGYALAHYLGQANADPAVCGEGHGYQPRMDEQFFDRVFDAFEEGKTDEGHFATCMINLLPRASAQMSSFALTLAARTYIDTLPEYQESPGALAKMQALLKIISARPAGVQWSKPDLSAFRAQLVHLLTDEEVGGATRAQVAEMLAVVDLETGRHEGEFVTNETIDGIDDIDILSRFNKRLPSADLRAHARRRIVRIRIADSKYPEVREDAARVERAVMKTGRNPLPADVRVLDSEYDTDSGPAVGVFIRQHRPTNTATFLGFSRTQGKISVFPAIELRDRLRFKVPLVESLVTFCAPADELDPSPCIDSSNLRLDNDVAHFDENGSVHFVEHLKIDTAIDLLDDGGYFRLSPGSTTQPYASIDFGLWYESPGSFVQEGSHGGRGPDLRITVRERHGRFIFNVSGRKFVVQRGDAGRLQIGSRGGRGRTGSAGMPGMNGSAGMSGSPASCYGSGTNGGRGGNGTSGGNGGPGGKGGDGGKVLVTFACDGPQCAASRKLLRSMLVSEGGAGGAGGPGGRGGAAGPGGRGGSGTSCTANGQTRYQSGGGSGSSGSPGSAGMSGSSGSPGRAGKIIIRLASDENEKPKSKQNDKKQ